MEDERFEGGGSTSDPWWWYASAALAIVFIFFLLSAFGQRHTPASLEKDNATADTLAADYSVKTALTFRDLPSGRQSGRIQLFQALDKYREAADAGSPSGARRAGVIGYEIEGTKGLSAFDKLTAPKTLRDRSKKDIADLRSERAMWRDIYSGDLTPKKVADYAARMQKLRLGPTRGYALRQLYTIAHQPRRAVAAFDDAGRSAAATFIPAMLLMILLFFGGVAGVVFIVIFAIKQSEAPSPSMQAPREIGLKHPYVLFQGFAVYVLLLLGLSGIAASALGPTLKRLDSAQMLMDIVLLQFALSAVTGLISLIVLSVLLRAEGGSLADLGLRTANLGCDVLYGMAGFCVLLPIYVVAAIVSMAVFRGIKTPEHPVVPLLASGGPTVFLLLFITGAMFAPFFEEIFFRGALYRALRVRLSFPVSTIIASAAFALVHPQLPAGFLPIFAMGSVACVLTETRQSLVPSMVLHAMNNGLIFLMMYLLYAG